MADQFPINSRYRLTLATEFVTADGARIVYLTRRFVPPATAFQSVAEHRVAAGDRLDNLASQYLGDPELYWRISDANSAMRPDDLTQPVGRKLKITLPQGIPGQKNAG